MISDDFICGSFVLQKELGDSSCYSGNTATRISLSQVNTKACECFCTVGVIL